MPKGQKMIKTKQKTHIGEQRGHWQCRQTRQREQVTSVIKQSQFSWCQFYTEIHLISSVNTCVTKATTYAFVLHSRAAWPGSARNGTVTKWEPFSPTVEKPWEKRLLDIKQKSLRFQIWSVLLRNSNNTISWFSRGIRLIFHCCQCREFLYPRNAMCTLRKETFKLLGDTTLPGERMWASFVCASFD